MRRVLTRLLSVTVPVFTLAVAGCSPENDCPPGCLSPDTWDAAAWAQAWSAYDGWELQESETTSTGGMVVDAAVAPSAMAGAEALKIGGSAADAAVVAALHSVVASGGGPVSLAGVSALVYFDAESETTHFLNGGWRTVSREDDLPSVPADRPSGRAILVPGFMASLEALHKRFGRLPFSALFEPAIHTAENGFSTPGHLAAAVERNAGTLGRIDETRSIFTNDDGSWIEEGDLLRQPALAETLRRVAAEGASYMYSGPWAERLVAAVRREGGHMSIDDLEAYQARWEPTAAAHYGAHEVHVPGGTATGGTTLLEALRLAERAGVRETGPVHESAESLYWMSRIGYLLWVADFRLGELSDRFPELATDPEGRRTPANADQLWQRMQTDAWNEFVEADVLTASGGSGPSHTDAIVAVDAQGNVAALIFSSNIIDWGRAGLFVDGVSIPDAGTPANIRAQSGLQPGEYVANQLNPLVVLRDGRPLWASAALGAGIHHATVQSLVNALDFGMDPISATRSPQLLHFAWPGAPGTSPGTPIHTHLVEDGRFSTEALDSVRSRGQPVVEVPPAAARQLRGRLSVIGVDSQNGTLRGVAMNGGGAAGSVGSH